MTKPRTLVTTIRCDARDAAMIHRLLVSSGIHSKNLTDLFREAFSILAEVAVTKEITPRVESTQEAIDILRSANLVDPLDNKTARLAISKQIAAEAFQEEFSQEVTTRPAPKEARAKEDVLSEVQERLKKRREEDAKILEAMRKVPKDVVEGELKA